MTSRLYTDASVAPDFSRAAGGILLLREGHSITTASIEIPDIGDSHVAELVTAVDGIIWAARQGFHDLDVRSDNEHVVRSLSALLGGARRGVVDPRPVPAEVPARLPSARSRKVTALHLQRLVDRARKTRLTIRFDHGEEIKICDAIARSTLGLVGRTNFELRLARYIAAV